MNRILSVAITALLIGALAGMSVGYAQQAANATKNQLAVARAIEVYRAALTGVNNVYVDTINVSKVTTNGINAMLSQLDPYTEYMPEVEREDFAMITSGEYAGIGAYIQQADSMVYVQTPMPGSPTMKAGLRMGDAFVEIDGESMISATASKVSGKLKGPVGTDVTVTIRRLGEKNTRKVVITRANVTVNQVVYRDLYQDSIGYIRLSSFTDKSADDVLRAYRELNRDGKVKNLILDLRSNGGGVLDGAVDILGMFVPTGSKVLYTEGKLPQTSQEYYTSREPVSLDIPIVVLINGGSASASEIVAGALQDMDRAVLVGSKSFGKGLVQNTQPMPYNGLLKVTIARYFIPSGRCIQQLDYSHRNPDGSVAAVPDSLTKVFYTKNGRPVRDGGGIRPDYEVKDELLSSPVYTMIRDGYLFKFANVLFLERPAAKAISDVQITDADFDRLLEYLKKENFKYGELSLKGLEQLQNMAEYEGYEEQSKEAFENLKKALTPSIERDLLPHRQQIKELLRGVLASHYFGSEGQYAVNAESDASVKKAVEILSSHKQYRETLTQKTANGK